MATTQTFGGGVHPREIGNGKSATQSQQIVNAAAPARVTIADGSARRRTCGVLREGGSDG